MCQYKSTTHKQYQERMNRVWLYIQQHLDEKLLLEDLAAIALLSPFHFHRIFTTFTGESVIQYVRRLKLERAAIHILHSNSDFTQIALNCAYETPAAFSRAFKQHFGISPSKYRQINMPVYRNNSYSSDLVEHSNIKPKIIVCNDQKVRFVRSIGPYQESAANAWKKLENYRKQYNLPRHGKRQLKEFGIAYDSPNITEENKIRYDACITVDHNAIAEGEFGIQTIKGGKYAVFLHSGSYSGIANTLQTIIFDWLFYSDYELTDKPIIQEYLNSEQRCTAPETLQTNLYFPIKQI